MRSNTPKTQDRVVLGRRHVLRELHTCGARTPREIASSLARLGLSYAVGTVEERIRELEELGLVRTGPASSVGLAGLSSEKRAGRPRHYATLSDVWGLGLGVEIGRAAIRAGVVSPTGDLIAKDEKRRTAHRLEPTFQTAASLVDSALRQLEPHDRAHVRGVMVAVPAPVNRGAQTVPSDVLPGWGVGPLDERLSASLETDLPITVVNDANARAIAEGRFGAARRLHSAFVIKASRTIGGALLRRGRLQDGFRGLAGETGHVGVFLDALPNLPKDLKLPPLDPDAVCSCQDATGQHLDAYASTDAIIARLHSARNARHHPASRGSLKVPRRFEDVVSEWRSAPDARRAVEDAARLLGQAVATVVQLCDPEGVVLTGRLATCGNDVAEPMRHALAAIRPLRDPPPVFVHGPNEATAEDDFRWVGVRGAGRLAIELQTSADDPPAPPV